MKSPLPVNNIKFLMFGHCIWQIKTIKLHMKNTEFLELEERFPDEQERLRYIRAKARVKEVRGFYTHFLIYIAVNIAIVFLNINGLKESESYFQPKNFFTLSIWGIFVLMHAGRVFLPNFMLGKNWEEKQIQKILDQEKQYHGKSR